MECSEGEALPWERWAPYIGEFFAHYRDGMEQQHAADYFNYVVKELLAEGTLPDLGVLQKYLSGIDAPLQLRAVPITDLTKRPGAYTCNVADHTTRDHAFRLYFSEPDGLSAADQLMLAGVDPYQNIELLRERAGFYLTPVYLLN